MNKRIVLTLGTFDILHVGHLNLLAACRRIAGREGFVVVGLNGDEFIEQYKGEYPVMSFGERRRLLEALEDVDSVVANTDLSTQKATIAQGFQMGTEAPPSQKFLVIGSDWARKDYYEQLGISQEWLDSLDIQLIYVPYTQGISSTKLRRHLADLD